MRLKSWVAITTEVPSRLSSMKGAAAVGQRRVDVAGRLVGEQQVGPHDERAGDGGTLLFAARENRRQHMHPVA